MIRRRIQFDFASFHKEKIPKEKRENFIFATWKSFATQTTFHGVKYLIEASFNLLERSLWTIALISAIFGTFYTCSLLSQRFRSSLLSTVMESTNYPVTKIPFPGVTICNNNRLDYTKLNATLAKFCANCSETQKSIALEYIKILRIFEWGSWDEFDSMDVKSVDHLVAWNTSEVYEFMMHDCTKLFLDCEWKKEKFDCCKKFIRRRTEYGICWSFNSFTPGRDDNELLMITKSGLKSGLRVKVNTFPSPNETVPEDIKSGVFAIVHHSGELARSGMFISGGSKTAVRVKPIVFSTSEDVQKLTPLRRQCYFQHESEPLHLMHLEGLPYMRTNCMSECRQFHCVKFCNCSMNILFPTARYRQCNIRDFFCLSKYNVLLNAEKSKDDEPGIECSCLPECSRIAYDIELQPMYNENAIDEKHILLDIHFAEDFTLKYRTDVTFSEMDLIVGFGGIVSLFLGSSLMSLIEIIYFSTIALFNQYRRNRRADKKKRVVVGYYGRPKLAYYN